MKQPKYGPGESVLVIGLGKSGIACATVLRERGMIVYATDEKPADQLSDVRVTLDRLGARFIAPSDVASVATSLVCAVLSPGVPLTSPVVRAVQAANVSLFGEIEVAAQLCVAPIIAVTGTKGKSTATALIGHLLRHCGLNVVVGGNIGNPLIAEVLAAPADAWVVAEVSSFQLETIAMFRPRVSVLLNVAPDHLDRYTSMDEYARAKFRIFENQTVGDVFVGNLDDALIASLAEPPGAGKRQEWYTLRGEHDGSNMYLDGTTIMYESSAAEKPLAIIERSDIPLAGEHNVQNVMAALLASLAAGCDPADLRAGVKTFRAMPHRLEPLGEIAGVLYIDDSKSTNPGSVAAALQAYDRPIVLIAGGRSKGTDFAEMGELIRERAKALVVIGEAAEEIASHARGTHTVRAGSMVEAVRFARDVSARGDVVVLSPGCASFDMFRSAEDRGEQFAAAVAALREAVDA
jgi:UDP-N-acetylmuramoylalanine--D-glutamate ligase